MSDIVLAVTESALAVLPCLAPMNRGQTNQDEARQHLGQAFGHFVLELAAPLQTMITGQVVIDAGIQSLQWTKHRIAFRGMKVSARWVTPQRPPCIPILLPCR